MTAASSACGCFAPIRRCLQESGKIVARVRQFSSALRQAIYDALVRLPQIFPRASAIDGKAILEYRRDNAAAYRIRSAVTEVARLLLDGIDENAVDFGPIRRCRKSGGMPGASPSVANGSQGIAVGMATAIPRYEARCADGRCI